MLICAGDEHATCSITRPWSKNLETLLARGVHVVDPGSGYLACGWIGKGRLAEPDEVVAAAEQVLRLASAWRPKRRSKGINLAGRRVLITAGPTYEDIDPVRYVGNRSSGRMGYALAAEALRPRRRGDARDRTEPPAGAARRRGGHGAQRRRRCTRP